MSKFWSFDDVGSQFTDIYFFKVCLVLLIRDRIRAMLTDEITELSLYLSIYSLSMLI